MCRAVPQVERQQKLCRIGLLSIRRVRGATWQIISTSSRSLATGTPYLASLKERVCASTADAAEAVPRSAKGAGEVVVDLRVGWWALKDSNLSRARPTAFVGSLLGANKITRQKNDRFKSIEDLREARAFAYVPPRASCDAEGLWGSRLDGVRSLRRGDASAPSCWRHPVDAREHARHVALIAESGRVRCLCQ